MQYRCSCGELSQIRWNDFKDGVRCNNCKGKRLVKTREENQSHWAITGVYSPPTNQIELICKNCNEKYKVPKCKENTSKFCGKKCHSKYRTLPDTKERKLFYCKMRSCLQHFLNIFNLQKTSRTHKLLGYNVDEFRNHIKSHPTWASFKDKQWSLDHIFPIKAFKDHNICDPKIVNSLKNLRPLTMQENLIKLDTYDKNEFHKWLVFNFKIVISI
jgi:DNA-directed RNA polymerase subunit RPC12/RpoP